MDDSIIPESIAGDISDSARAFQYIDSDLLSLLRSAMTKFEGVSAHRFMLIRDRAELTQKNRGAMLEQLNCCFADALAKAQSVITER
jgi:hypothetical protein